MKHLLYLIIFCIIGEQLLIAESIQYQKVNESSISLPALKDTPPKKHVLRPSSVRTKFASNSLVEIIRKRIESRPKLIIAKAILLAALVKILITAGAPIFCSSVYASANFLFSLAFGFPFTIALVYFGLFFIISTIFFLILNQLEAGSLLWWAISISGVFIIACI